MTNIYYEKQRGDLCRLHSINAYFGFRCLKETDFFKLCDEYDNIIKGLKTNSMDGFSEGRCIISHILQKLDNKFLFLIPIKSYDNSRNTIDIDRYSKLISSITNVFEFNKNHVWINKQINNKWYKIDSISGVNHINQPRLGSSKNGFLLVLDGKVIYNELEYQLKIVNSDKDKDIEVNLINLKFILDTIYLERKNTNNHINGDYNDKLNNLKSIHKLLNEFVLKNRENKETSNLVSNIKSLINKFLI